MGKLVFINGQVPPCKSEQMTRLARHFMQLKEYYHDARRPLEVKWRLCDEAYLCYRWLPDTGAIDFIDDSEFGETDGFDNVNTIVIRMLQAILPPGMPYLNPSASDPSEPQDTTDAIRDFLLFKHREARTRRQLAKWLKMMTVRGDGAFFWEHVEEYEYKPVLGPKAQQHIADALKTGGIPHGKAKDYVKVMEQVCKFNGPQIRTVDTHDYFFSPVTDLTNKRKEPFIVQTYRYAEELIAEEDANGKKVYENLEGIEGFYAYDLWGRMNDGAARIRSLQVMGIQPEADRGFTRLIPVYIVYVPYLKFEDLEFYDMYFHVAVSANGSRLAESSLSAGSIGGGRGGSLGGGARMIRVESNPTRQRQFLFDTYHDFFTNAPYGISALEKSLTGLRQKNVLGALMFNAAVAAQFPAQNVMANAFKDGEVSFMPGGINEVDGMVDVTKVMAPVPTPDKGLQLAWADMKFWGDELRSKMNIDGLQAESATRSVSKNKTATEVNRDTSSGNLFLDEMVAKYSDTLTEFFQGSFQVMQERALPNEEGYLEYQRNLTGRVTQDKLALSDFQKPRSITVGFLQGIFDKGQRLQGVVQALDMVSRSAPFLPNAAGVINSLVQEGLRLLNVPVDQKAFMSPEQLAAQNPQVQVAALQQALQQIGTSTQAGQMIPPNIGGGGIVDASQLNSK